MEETLKQKFKVLLAYQKKDIELRKINLTLERDVSLAEMNKHKRAFNEAKQAISECEQAAGGLLEQFAALQKYIEDNEALLAELENADETGEEELESRVRRLESLKSKFQTADKKMHDIDDKSKTVCKRRGDALKYGNAAKQKFGEARDKHNALVSSKADEIARLKAELDQMRLQLDKKLFEEYESLVNDNKFPPVVPAAASDKKDMFNCGGCGLSLPQNGNALLSTQGWCRCDNCRRIIVHLS